MVEAEAARKEEAKAQATELVSIVPIVQRACERLVLAGDHCQLPPTVQSPEAERRGLTLSLYGRLEGLEPYFLDTQFRAHPKLMEWVAGSIYEGRLQSGILEAARPPLKGFEWPKKKVPVAFVEMGRWAGESVEYESKMNQAEAERVLQIIESVLEAGCSAEDVGVITPYMAQVRLLRMLWRNRCQEQMGRGMRLKPLGRYENRKRSAHLQAQEKGKKKKQPRTLEIASVDNFQGREKELIVFSAVRNNPAGRVGFLADWRRLNVMLTRARRGLIVVGNGFTLRKDQLGVEQVTIAWHAVLRAAKTSACKRVKGLLHHLFEFEQAPKTEKAFRRFATANLAEQLQAADDLDLLWEAVSAGLEEVEAQRVRHIAEDERAKALTAVVSAKELLWTRAEPRRWEDLRVQLLGYYRAYLEAAGESDARSKKQIFGEMRRPANREDGLRGFQRWKELPWTEADFAEEELGVEWSAQDASAMDHPTGDILDQEAQVSSEWLSELRASLERTNEFFTSMSEQVEDRLEAAREELQQNQGLEHEPQLRNHLQMMVQELQGTLQELTHFCEANDTACYKILKKHDKQTGLNLMDTMLPQMKKAFSDPGKARLSDLQKRLRRFGDELGVEEISWALERTDDTWQVARISFCLGVISMALLVLLVLSGMEPQIDQYSAEDLAATIPVLRLTRAHRHLFVRLLVRIFCFSCLGEVSFAENVVADVLTSLGRPLKDVAYTVCYFRHWHTDHDREVRQICKSSAWTSPMLQFLLLLPLLFRVAQCLRRLKDSPRSDAVKHSLNCGKYLLAVLVSLLNSMSVPPSGWTTFQLKLVQVFGCLATCYVAATVYATAWDLTVDFGLTHSNRRRIYPNASYLIAAALDTSLRSTWLLTLQPDCRRYAPVTAAERWEMLKRRATVVALVNDELKHPPLSKYNSWAAEPLVGFALPGRCPS
eukprot:g327.t1